MSESSALGRGSDGEFAAIRAMLACWGDLAEGAGDDAAILDPPAGQRLVVSTDTSTEHVHFRRGWLTAREIGARATIAALSDLAAMGASPLGILVAATIPSAWRSELLDLADGVGDAARSCGARILGGDTTDGRDLSLTVTVLGAATRPLTRAGAQPGDILYVTGTLGGPGAAWRAFEQGIVPNAAHRARFAHPVARLGEGRWLADHGAHAAVDISDGLLADADHLAAASGAQLEIALETLPLVGGVTREEGAASGEEYELLVAAPALDTVRFLADTGVPLTAIGRVRSRDGASVVVTLGGARVDLPRGYDHFA